MGVPYGPRHQDRNNAVVGVYLRIADEREVQKDDIVLCHGKVVLHCGILKGDQEVFFDHAALADHKVVQLRRAQAVSKTIHGTYNDTSFSQACCASRCLQSEQELAGLSFEGKHCAATLASRRALMCCSASLNLMPPCGPP